LEIEALAREKVTGGCSTNPFRFCPGGSITRGEMAVFLCKAAGKDALGKPTPTFADVGTGHPYYGWIERLADAGSWCGNGAPAAGCADGPPRLFCPSDPIDRDELAVWLDKAQCKYSLPSWAPSFADVPTSHWAYGYIETLANPAQWGNNPAANGCSLSPRKFCPDDSVTRAHAAVFLVRAYKLPVLTSSAQIKRELAGTPATYARFSYPAILVERGVTMTWTNTDPQQTHNVRISLTGTESGPLSNGQSFQWYLPLDAPLGQSFSYYCSLHPAEVGYIQAYAVNAITLQRISDELSGPLEVNPGNGGDGSPGGLAIFADAAGPAGPWRDRLRVVAQLSYHKPYEPISCRVVDVDDPSSDAAPVDPNGQWGDDNQDMDGDGQHDLVENGCLLDPADNQWKQQVNLQADADGKAVLTLSVPHQPGDNLRVAAASEADYVAAFTGSGVDVINSGGQEVGNGGRGEVSDLLTVWRYLHIEKDSMKAVEGNIVSGRILTEKEAWDAVVVEQPPAWNGPGRTRVKVKPYLDASPRYQGGSLSWPGVVAPVLANGQTTVVIPSAYSPPLWTTVLTLADAPQGWIVAVMATGISDGPGPGEKTVSLTVALDDNPFPGRFDDGTFTTGGQTYHVAENRAAEVVVEVQYGPPTQPQPTAGAAFTIHDDDAAALPQWPDLTDFIAQAFREVYVKPLDDAAAGAGGVNQNSCRFLLNIRHDDKDPAAADRQVSEWRQSEDTQYYWASYVQMAYQGHLQLDYDPDLDGMATGCAARNGVFIFREPIREGCNWTGYLRNMVIHEVGHDFQLEHTHLGGMRSPTPCTDQPIMPFFTDQARHDVRSRPSVWGYWHGR